MHVFDEKTWSLRDFSHEELFLYGCILNIVDDAKGNLWPCIVFMGQEQFSYGNLYNASFEEIWEGERRKKLIQEFSQMDLEKNCRELCRLDEMNKYLNDLRNPGLHVNFI